jgi:hypothetical protein
MACTLTKKCPACGEHHELILAGPEHMADSYTDYEYTCPKTHGPVLLKLKVGDWWETVQAKPRGAIVVTERA